MTKELKNLLSLLESPIQENRDLGAVVAQNFKEEVKTHFGYEIAEYQELITFLVKYADWRFETPIMEITISKPVVTMIVFWFLKIQNKTVRITLYVLLLWL